MDQAQTSPLVAPAAPAPDLADPCELELQDPWHRFGWLVSTIWLVFLIFPIVSILEADASAGARAVGLLAVAGFAASYLLAFRMLYRGHYGIVFGAVACAVFAAWIGIVATVIGINALGMVTFVVAFSMFAVPLPAAATVLAICVALCLVVPASQGELAEYGFFAGIVFFVALATGLIRFLETRDATYKELREEATLAGERDRVARDVHDVLGHSLTVVAVKAELAQRLVDVDPERAKAELDAIRSLSREALAEIRATVVGLRVARIAEELDAAREALAGAGIAAELPENAEAVDPRHRIVVAWVLREAVTNVVRHSGASRCAVTFGPSTLRVADDGRGLGSSSEGNGLRGVRERVAAVGGRLTVGPGLDGRGLSLEVDLS